MYCYEAHKCSNIDCPIQREQIRRCWEYFEKSQKKVTIEDCPHAPCNKCSYRLGWEIGLITDSLFPDSIEPTAESLLPSFIPQDKVESQKDLQPESKYLQNTNKIVEAKLFNTEHIGKKGTRFCYELMECHNTKCVVIQQEIISCFKFFSRKSLSKKSEMTCCSRQCDICFYQKGWELNILHEGLFDDILEKKKLKIIASDRIKRNSLVDIYLSELARKPLSRKEEVILAQKIAGDKNASELFLLANLKLVLRVAKKFSSGSLGIMDLIQEGNIGLIKAIAKFDYTLGYRFSTYAAYWIRYYMQKAVAHQGSALVIPHHILAVAHKIRKKIQEFERSFFRSPVLSEISEVTGIESNKILSILSITQTPVSIQAKMDENDENGIIEYYLEDKKNLTPEEQALENLKNEAIKASISDLPDRLQYIVKNFYGFENEELNLAEIGRRMNISRERTRQLLYKALQLLQEKKLISDLKL